MVNFLTNLLGGAPVLAETTPVTMSSFLTEAGTLLTQIFGTWIPEICSAILSQPILAIGFYILVISLAVGFVLRIAGSR